MSLLLDNTLVAPFRTSSSAPSTSILIQFTSSCFILFKSKRLSKVSVVTSMKLSEFIDQLEITVLYYNYSLGIMINILSLT
jgi:hypothetical protein